MRKNLNNDIDLTKLNLGEIKDVYGDCREKDLTRNTNIKSRLDHFEEFSWGYLGVGPHSLAANILYQFTGDEKFAYEFRAEFVHMFLGNASRNRNLYIPKELISRWIEIKKTNGHSREVL